MYWASDEKGRKRFELDQVEVRIHHLLTIDISGQ